MASTIEEYLVELTRAIGDAHAAVIDGVGSATSIGSALFEVMQLRQLAQGGLPQFGVLDTVGFAVTPSATSHALSISAGQIGYLGSRIIIPPQDVPAYRPLASTYGSLFQYGVRLGLPLSEAAKTTTLYSTTVTAATQPTDQSLRVADLSTVTLLGFPLTAHVGNTLIVFSGLTPDGLSLQVDPGFLGGTVQAYHSIGETVYFLYLPRVRAVCGLPVDTPWQSGGDPSTFAYFPPIPKDWLPIADVLMVNPANPSVVVTGSSPTTYAIRQTFTAWPTPGTTTPAFSASDAPTIVRACDNLRASLSQVLTDGSVAELIRGLESYTRAIQTDTTASFRQYWGQQPFRQNSYFDRGASFDSLERIEFPDVFARAYYDVTGSDVQHTLAIFRGDRYAQTSPITGSAPTGQVAAFLPAAGVPSTFGAGTYLYAVTAVTSSGETPTPSTYAQVQPSSGPVVVHLRWDSVPGALFYHIYRRSTITGDLSEYRLTGTSGVVGYGHAQAASVTNTAYEALSSVGTATQFTAAASTHLGGLSVRLKVSAPVTNPADFFTVTLRADLGGAPGSVLATGTPIPYSSLLLADSAALSLLDYDMTAGQKYWIVLAQSAPPTGGTISLGRAATGAASFATSSDRTSWTTQNGKDLAITLYSFLDNGRVGQGFTHRGLRMTGRIAQEPRQISVYVPPMIPPTSDYSYYGESLQSGVALSTATQNELLVTVVALNGAGGTPTTLSARVLQGTPRGTRIPLGSASQLFDRIIDVTVSPGSGLALGAGSTIQWSVYDLITVETTP